MFKKVNFPGELILKKWEMLTYYFMRETLFTIKMVKKHLLLLTKVCYKINLTK